MKCEYYVFDNEVVISSIYIDKNSACFKKGDTEQFIDVDTKKCFNTLISLYGLKDSWNKKECINPVYKVVFENEDKKDVYVFEENNVPDNWLMFIGYIAKLVGNAA